MFKVDSYQPKIFSKYIEAFKVYHFRETEAVKLDPEGHFELIFQLDNEFLHDTPSTNGWELRPRNFIGGLHTKSYSIQPTSSNAKVFGIQFKAGGAKYFIPDKLQRYKNQIIQINDAIQAWEEFALEILQTKDFQQEGVVELERLLCGLYQERKYSAIDKALEIIINRHGFVNMTELARQVNLSSSQFRKRFNEEVGMSPKEYSKIVRFRTIRKKIQQEPKLKLTDISYQMGYFDQAHFIKDFQSVCGLSPKHYRLG